MKNKTVVYLCILSILLLSINRLFAQNLPTGSKKTPSGWTTNNPFHTNVFVENKGQFNNWAKSKLPILYAVNNSDKIFFTKNSVIFKIEKIDTTSEEDKERSKKYREKENDEDKETYYVSLNWEGCNAEPTLIASNPAGGYYTFGEKGYEDVKAKGFEKILYKDIYPGIDVEYIIPEKGGVKYKLIVHPGANPNVVKMHYGGNINLIKKDADGNIIIQTPVGNITDYAPICYYENTN